MIWLSMEEGMNLEVFDVNNTYIQLVMVLKMQQLKKSDIPTLRYENLEDYLSDSLWKKDCPRSLHSAINQILSVKAQDIVRYLAKEAIVQSKTKNISEFADLIGGN